MEQDLSVLWSRSHLRRTAAGTNMFAWGHVVGADQAPALVAEQDVPLCHPAASLRYRYPSNGTLALVDERRDWVDQMCSEWLLPSELNCRPANPGSKP